MSEKGRAADETPTCTDRVLTSNTWFFAAYGSFMASTVGSTFLFLSGILLVVVLSIGIKDIEYETDLGALWIEEGSRSEDELRFVESTFGGSSNTEQIFGNIIGPNAPVNDNDKGLLVKDELYAFGNLSATLFATADPVLNITRTFPVGGVDTDLTFTWHDLCTRIDMPDSLKPWDASLLLAGNVPFDDSNTILTWLGAGSVDSGLLFHTTNCLDAKIRDLLVNTDAAGLTLGTADWFQIQTYLADFKTPAEIAATFGDATLVDELMNDRLPLHFGFGINQAPCSRAGILDCWSDGAFDYQLDFEGDQDDLDRLQDFGMTFAALTSADLQAALGALNGGQPLLLEQCLSELNDTLVPLESAVPGLSADAVLTSFDAIAAPFAIGFGYWWKNSIEDEDAIGNLATSFVQGVNNSINSDPQTCILEGTFNKIERFSPIAALSGNTIPGSIADGSLNATLQFAGVDQTSIDLLIGSFSLLLATNPNQGGCCLSFAATVNPPELVNSRVFPLDFQTNDDTSGAFIFASRFSGTIDNSRSVLFQQRLENEKGIDNVDNDIAEQLVLDFEQEIINALLPAQERQAGSGFGPGEVNDNIQINFLVGRSTADMLEDAASIETNLLVAGYVVLVVYASLNFIVYRCNAVGWTYSRVGLCLGGIGVIFASTAASFGLSGWIGEPLSPLNSALVPFLSVGLGIDDLFVLLHELNRHHQYQADPAKRITMTWASAGSSVTVTSVSNTVAFLISSVVPLSAVYSFAYQMAMAIALNWLCLMLIIGPLMYWDAIRTSSRGCLRPETNESDVRGVSDERKLSVHYFVKHVLCPLYVNPIFKVVALCVFFGMTIGLAVYGFLNVEEGLLLSDVAIDDDYNRPALLLIESEFPLFPSSIITRTIDFEDPDGNTVDFSGFQLNLLAALDDLAPNSFVDKTSPPSHFIESVISFGNSVLGTDLQTLPENLFFTFLGQYFRSVGVVDLGNAICKNTTSDLFVNCLDVDQADIELISTKGSFSLNGIRDDPDYINAIKTTRADLDGSGGNFNDCCDFTGGSNGTQIDPIPIFLSGTVYEFWQQYVDINRTTAKTVGFALIGVFFTTLIFQASPLSSLIVSFFLIATVLQLYGLLEPIGVKLNGFSVVNLAIAVGMAVEFTAHICYAFLRAPAPPSDRNLRMQLALEEMFPPMLNGAMTTFISVIVLSFAKYPFFTQYYFQMISLMIWLAFINGLVFLPVVLSLIGPKGLSDQQRQLSESVSFKGKGVDTLPIQNAAL